MSRDIVPRSAHRLVVPTRIEDELPERLTHVGLSGAPKLGGVALAGFNCAGEIGPVGGKKFLHGFTASIALLTKA